MKGKKQRVLVDYIPAALTAVLIIVFAVWRQQSLLKTLPTLVTLVVQILMAHANRRGFLLGAANSVLYAAAYWTEGIYFSVVSALLGAGIQVYSYFSWRRHSHHHLPDLKLLGAKKLIAVIALILGGWAACRFLLAPFFANAAYPAVDALGFVLGQVVSVLVARRYLESQYFQLVSASVSLALWILLTVRDPANFNYVIISVYNLLRIVEGAVVWSKTYIKEKKECIIA